MQKKLCWIIGASHGIGESLAKKYFESGFDLAISARSEDKLKSIRNEILSANQNSSGQILVSKTDVSEAASIQSSADEIIAKFGRIDLVIFCSAIYQPTKAIGFDLDESLKTINVNLNGAFNLLHVILPQFTKQNSGHIAFVASVAGYRGLPQSFAYGASKAALINLCEGIYPELKRLNIDVSVINPGFVKTRLTDKNSFSMPFIITPQKAAEIIYQGLEAKKFEIHFPKIFTTFLKILRILPNFIFLKIVSKIK
jgi:short-subunit dehydrogenase